MPTAVRTTKKKKEAPPPPPLVGYAVALPKTRGATALVQERIKQCVGGAYDLCNFMLLTLKDGESEFKSAIAFACRIQNVQHAALLDLPGVFKVTELYGTGGRAEIVRAVAM